MWVENAERKYLSEGRLPMGLRTSDPTPKPQYGWKPGELPRVSVRRYPRALY